jgi:MYXO-CTERM domain-containing protein
MALAGDRIALRVDDTDAEYPVVVDPLVWGLRTTIKPTDSAGDDYFGTKVSLSGTTLAVGSNYSGTGSKALYVFVQTGATWIQQQKLVVGTELGGAVRIDGDTIIAGGTNAAYVFVRTGTTWSQQQKLTGSDTVAGDGFGGSVAISGDTVIVGAANKAGGGNKANAGAAYVFVRSGTVWTQQQKLLPSDPAAGDYFGGPAISGDTAIIGAGTKNGGKGAAYVFVRSGTTWTQQQKLDPADTVANDGFGGSSSISGDTAVIGAHGSLGTFPPAPGAAYVFVRSGTTFTQQQKLTVAGTNFGSWSALAGDTALIGGASSGYIFTRTGTTWTQGPTFTTGATSDGAIAPGIGAIGDIGTDFGIPGTVAALVLGDANGSPCTAATSLQCISGYCQDGVCCDAPCPGQCEACDVPGSVGKCSPVTGPPHGARSACVGNTADATCGLQCNGDKSSDRTACHYPPNGALCSGAGCAGGYETKPSYCDGAGNCGDNKKACAPFQCGTTACKSTCTNATTDCAPGFECVNNVCVTPAAGAIGAPCTPAGGCAQGLFCTDGVCCTSSACPGGSSCATPKGAGTCMKINGTACTSGTECGTGFCVDGLCCNTLCDRQCEACDTAAAPGQCVGVSGTPHGRRPPCGGSTGVCEARACNGAVDPSVCVGFVDGPSTVCGPPSCAGSVFTGAKHCDGAGTCKAPDPSRCDPYTCDGQACRTSCTATEQCSAGFSCHDGKCQGATCDGDHTTTTADGKTTNDCAPYKCESNGSCSTSCTSVTDCVPPTVCDRSGACVSAPVDDSASAGCMVSHAPSRPDSSAAAVFAVLGALVARRRRAAQKS